MPVRRLKAFLDEQGVRYVTMRHSPAYTAQEIAQTTHVPGKDMAKTVMVKLDGEMAMAVVPASYRVNLEFLERATCASYAELATETEFQGLFPGVEIGAMPPFGNLYGMPVYVSESLADNKEIAFNAGSHTEVIKMAFEDFERLAHPTMLQFSEMVVKHTA